MWFSRHNKDESGHSQSSGSNHSKSKSGKKEKTNRRLRRGKDKDTNAGASSPSSSNTAATEEQPVVVLQSSSPGDIEVSLSQEGPSSSLGPFPAELALHKKVYRSQYNVSHWPVLEQAKKKEEAPTTTLQPKASSHRVPLSGTNGNVAQQLYDDVLLLLRAHEVVDEEAAVRSELNKLNAELDALQADRTALEAAQQQHKLVADEETPSPQVDWELHRLLLASQSSSKQPTVSAADRQRLQEKRGLCWTLSLHNPQAQQAFLERCGYRNGKQKATKSRTTVTPKNCRDGGAATTVQHVGLLKGSSESAFFLTHDNGSTQTKKDSCFWGHVPERLFRRLHASKHSSATDLVYLSTGPLGAYYAEFRSGECWWGCPTADDDDELDRICSEWDVYRVAFGSGTTTPDHHLGTSWIVLSRDGRAAWKNLPARLHRQLETRLASEAAPSEVSLGSGGSYFVRFLDGSYDYCLPAHVADACRDLGKTDITCIALHPELSQDFVIRHC